MAVPPLAEFHRPVLETIAQSESSLTIRQIMDLTSDSLSLTVADKQEQEANGAFRWEKRVRWSVHYLKAYGGLISSPGYRQYEATAAGREYLCEHIGQISARDLRDLRSVRLAEQQSEGVCTSAGLQEVATALDKGTPLSVQSSLLEESIGGELFDDTDATPDDLVQTGYQQLQERLASEMLESVSGVTPGRFEMLVLDLLRRMGYGEPEHTGKSGDGGIDGIINQDALGLEKVYVQAKRWPGPVGEPEIRNFSGSLDPYGATKGVFITTSTFSSTARQTAQNISAGNKFIRLVDGDELARLMIRYGVGVVTETTYEVKKLDENYFAEDV